MEPLPQFPWQKNQQHIVVPLKIHLKQSNCKFCSVYLHLLLQRKKVAHFIFKTGSSPDMFVY
jgi:hypothetical protein